MAACPNCGHCPHCGRSDASPRRPFVDPRYPWVTPRIGPPITGRPSYPSYWRGGSAGDQRPNQAIGIQRDQTFC